MKKNILISFIILFFANSVFGACIVTGGACAIEDLNPNLKKQTTKKELKKTQKKEIPKLKNTKQKGGK